MWKLCEECRVTSNGCHVEHHEVAGSDVVQILKNKLSRSKPQRCH
jgi:hypothetical protein